jgi:uncharacterized protein (TIRG00374 family)
VRRRLLNKILVNVAKIAVVVGLLIWMTQSGKLDFKQLKIFIEKPEVALVSLGLWFFIPVVLGTFRWLMLVRGIGLTCTFLRAMSLQMIGFFFNAAMPGAVGGDIIKAVYIMRDQPEKQRRTPAMLTVLLDRIVGLAGLFLMGLIGTIFSSNVSLEQPATKPLVYGIYIFTFGIVVFLTLVYLPYKDGKDPFLKIFSLNVPGFKMIHGIYEALREYRKEPHVIIGTILLSIVIQLVCMAYMAYIGVILYGDAFDPMLLPSVFPFGILITAVPLAPGGLGLGHAAFEKLFSMVGLPGGANIFNVYALSQLILNLLGFIPYLTLRSKSQMPSLEQIYEGDINEGETK